MIRSSFAAAAAAAAALAPPQPVRAQAHTAFPARICDVTLYGARGTRVFLDTEAFQRAIDDCAAKGGGIVEVPRGEYLIGRSSSDRTSASTSRLTRSWSGAETRPSTKRGRSGRHG